MPPHNTQTVALTRGQSVNLRTGRIDPSTNVNQRPVTVAPAAFPAGHPLAYGRTSPDPRPVTTVRMSRTAREFALYGPLMRQLNTDRMRGL